jgi:hypothetical protein
MYNAAVAAAYLLTRSGMPLQNIDLPVFSGYLCRHRQADNPGANNRDIN